MRTPVFLTLLFLCLPASTLVAQTRHHGKRPVKLQIPIDSLTVNGTSLGSVDVVTENHMNKGLVTNPLNALTGQAAGVNITSGENRMAQLSSVRVRGTTSITGGNDPLVIIDGVYSDLSALSSVYPSDIESFTILKNAAETAQYGSRGASGVIEVKTKRGSGTQFHISYDGNIGSESKYKTLDMLDAPGYIATAQALGLYYKDEGSNTNFQDVITRTGYIANHHVAFSGGSKESSYRASLSAMDHNTIIRTNSYRNYAAKADLTQWAFDDLLKNHWEKLQHVLHLTDEEKVAARQEIRKLNPRPGSALGEVMGFNIHQITPDFIVETNDDGRVVFTLNRGHMPALEVSQSYIESLDSMKNLSKREKEAIPTLRRDIDKAKGLIDAIQQRQETLKKTMAAIIRRQERFFIDGDEADLRPMTLKDVASDTGLDISTISRVTNEKYAETHWGIFRLRFFFTDKIDIDGEEVSTRKLKILLQEIIDKEDKSHPLTDMQIEQEMKQKGFPIARRTIVKYREQLGIPKSTLRRQ